MLGATRARQGRISRRRLLRAAAFHGAGLGALAVVGCGGDTQSDSDRSTPSKEAAGQPRRGGTLISVLPGDPPNFHALHELNANSVAVTSLLYNTLVRTNPGSLKAEPDLAEKWEVAGDGMSYTFHLSPNAAWHDGSPVTSRDVKATYDYYLAKPPGLNTRKTDYLANVTKITTPDDRTVQIQLDAPRASLLASIGIGYMQIAPRAQIEADPSFFQTKENGSGAFKLENFTPGTSVKLTRNPSYFKSGQPYLDAIDLRIIKDSSTRLALLQAGRADMTWGGGSLSAAEVASIKQSRPEWTIDSLPGGFVAIFLNMTKPPMDDVRVRKAMTLAIDRQTAIRVVGQGEGQVGGYLNPGPFAISKEQLLQLPGYRQSKDQDIAQAKQLLAAAGYGGGLKIQTIYGTDLGPVNEAAALFAKDQLARVGIELALEPMLYADINKARQSKSWQAWVNRTGREGDDPFFAGSHLGPSNLFGVADKESFDLYDRQAVTIDESRRKALVTQFEQRLFDVVPYVPLYFWISNGARAPYVRNFMPTGLGYIWVPQFDGVWLDR